MFNKVSKKPSLKAPLSGLDLDYQDTVIPISKPSKSIKKHRGIVTTLNPSKAVSDSCKESSKLRLTRTFKSVANLSAVERNLEHFLKQHMEGEKGQGANKNESKYMELVEEELELFKVPKHLDNDLLKRERIYGEKATGIPGRPQPTVTIEDRIKALEETEQARRLLLKSELAKQLKR